MDFILVFVKIPIIFPSLCVRTDGQHGQAADKIMTRANVTLTSVSINYKIEIPDEGDNDGCNEGDGNHTFTAGKKLKKEWQKQIIKLISCGRKSQRSKVVSFDFFIHLR